MLYEDKYGRLWSEEDLYAFSDEEVEQLELHVYDRSESPVLISGDEVLDLEPQTLQAKFYGKVRGLGSVPA